MKCAECKKEIVKPPNCSTGYGTNKSGKKICYTCCAVIDKEQMRHDGKIVLYLVKHNDKYEITNWPGSLVIPVSYMRIGRHNIAGKRYDVWFWFEEQLWHGVSYGDNTQICYCKQNKN